MSTYIDPTGRRQVQLPDLDRKQRRALARLAHKRQAPDRSHPHARGSGVRTTNRALVVMTPAGVDACAREVAGDGD